MKVIVLPSSGKGKGVFATETIRQGQSVIREAPLITLPDTSKMSDETLKGHILAKLKTMNKDQKSVSLLS